jgi:hypothetical protein
LIDALPNEIPLKFRLYYKTALFRHAKEISAGTKLVIGNDVRGRILVEAVLSLVLLFKDFERGIGGIEYEVGHGIAFKAMGAKVASSGRRSIVASSV